MKKQVLIFTSLVFIFLISTKISLAATSVPYPEPPSQETLDALKRAGDENLRKYGAGPSAPVIKTYTDPKPTLAPSPSPTPIPSPTASPEEISLENHLNSTSSANVITNMIRKTWYFKVLEWFSKWF